MYTICHNNTYNTASFLSYIYSIRKREGGISGYLALAESIVITFCEKREVSKIQDYKNVGKEKILLRVSYNKEGKKCIFGCTSVVQLRK